MLTEDSSYTAVAGRGKKAAALEQNRGIHTIGDLLDHVPRRYLRPGELTDLSSLQVGEDVVFAARVLQVSERVPRGRRVPMLTAVVGDDTARLDVTFFSAFAHRGRLVPGRSALFVGTVGQFNGRLQLTHPDYEVLDGEPGADLAARADEVAGHLIPIYPSTGKVYSWQIRAMISMALDTVTTLREPVPEKIRLERGLVTRAEALELVHRPALTDPVEVGLTRLRYDEAFVLQTILAQRRAAAARVEARPRVPSGAGVLAAFDARLPFELTGGQRRIGGQIAEELAATRPMNRLLQGEVGSGKTLVALRAMLSVVDAGGQAALLAPTEVLAAQHFRSIRALLGDLGDGALFGGSDQATKVVLLTGSQSAATRRSVLNDLVTGEAGIVVGTHALIQKHVSFHDLALVVVDEQHRFGVEQRDALREKGSSPPHVLVMTATPIPRSVAMTVFGDMETSTLTELPAGRAPITTHVVDNPAWLGRTWQRVGEEIAAGRQVFVVCPKIGDDLGDPSGIDDAPDLPEVDDGDGLGPEGERDATRELTGVGELAERLRAEPALATARIEVLHGRLDADLKEARMVAFARGEIDVLVATTVIEVGVDVPNATVMVVMDADRFGMAQLHQLRGRVGRGGLPGLCLLVTPVIEGPARERLDAVVATTDGFALSRRDLQLRREGDVLGARQSGRGSSVRFLRMGEAADEELIAEAREDATRIVAQDPTLADHPDLRARVDARLDEAQAAFLERG